MSGKEWNAARIRTPTFRMTPVRCVGCRESIKKNGAGAWRAGLFTCGRFFSDPEKDAVGVSGPHGAPLKDKEA